MNLLHHYVQLGWDADKFINQDTLHLLFYKASMDVAIEDYNEQMRMGGKK